MKSKHLCKTLAVTVALYSSNISSFAAPDDQSKHLEPGISVREWKLYDERSLIQKFNSLRRNIDANSNFIDVSALKAAIGKVQSAAVTLSQLGLGLQVNLPVRSIADTVTNGVTGATSTGSTNGTNDTSVTGTSATGTSLNSTNNTNTSTSTNSNTSGTTTSATNTSGLTQTAVTIPTLPSTSQTSGLTPTGVGGFGALDTLQEQTQLTFEMFNISALLERSISDRIIDLTAGHDRRSVPRQNIVLEFPVTIDRPRPNQVAEVKITVKNAFDPKILDGKFIVGRGTSDEETHYDAPSVVAMMPKARTYNTATFTSSTRGFSFGTTLDVLGANFGSQNTKGNTYLARDVDMVAFADTGKDKNSVSFTWQFRPTLTRTLIEPGTREVFVMLSVPQDATGQISGLDYMANISVETSWHPYCHSNGQIGQATEKSDPVILDPPLIVRPVPAKDDSLKPFIHSFRVADAGGGKIQALLQGANFFDSTVVSLGTADGSDTIATISSEQLLRFVAPASKLFINDPEIIGPYGTGARITNGSLLSQAQFSIDESKSSLTPLNPDSTKVRIALKFPGLQPNNWAASQSAQSKLLDTSIGRGAFTLRTYRTVGSNTVLDNTVPILVNVGNLVYGLSDSPVDVIDDSKDPTLRTLEFVVSTNVLRQTTKFTVLPILFDKSLAKVYRGHLESDFQVASVKTLGTKKVPKAGATTPYTIVAIGGQGFYPSKESTDNPMFDPATVKPIQVIVNGVTYKKDLADYPLTVADNFLQLAVPTSDFNDADSIVVTREGAFPVILSIKDIKNPKPAVDPLLPVIPDQIAGGIPSIAVTLPKLDPKVETFTSANIAGVDAHLTYAVVSGKDTPQPFIQVDLTKFASDTTVGVVFVTNKGNLYVGTMKVAKPTTAPATSSGGKG